MYRPKNRPAAALKISQDIIPIGELKSHLSEKIRDLSERRRPLVVTQNGKAAAVLLSPEEFDQMSGQVEFVSAIAGGLEDLEAGRVLSHDELKSRLDDELGVAPRVKRK